MAALIALALMLMLALVVPPWKAPFSRSPLRHSWRQASKKRAFGQRQELVEWPLWKFQMVW